MNAQANRAFLNVFPEFSYKVRYVKFLNATRKILKINFGNIFCSGNSDMWNHTKRAGREWGAMLDISFVDEKDVQKAIQIEEVE